MNRTIKEATIKVFRYPDLDTLQDDAAERTVEALWKTIGKLLDQCSPTECANYIRYCGLTQSER